MAIIFTSLCTFHQVDPNEAHATAHFSLHQCPTQQNPDPTYPEPVSDHIRAQLNQFHKQHIQRTDSAGTRNLLKRLLLCGVSTGRIAHPPQPISLRVNLYSLICQQLKPNYHRERIPHKREQPAQVNREHPAQVNRKNVPLGLAEHFLYKASLSTLEDIADLPKT